MINKKIALVGLIAVSTVLLSSCIDKDDKKVMDDKMINHEWVEDSMEKKIEWNNIKDDKKMIPVEWDNGIWDGAEPLDEVMMKDDKMMKSAWVYTDYSEDTLKNAKWNIVLFFAATWCPSCQSADKNLKAEKIPEGLTVLKLDYDTNTELRKKYEVLSQHTFVQVDNKWNLIKKWSGSRDADSILEKIK